MDELLAGTQFLYTQYPIVIIFLLHTAMISKGRGLTLRLSVVLHILFQLGTTTTSPTDSVSDEALKAAINFVMVAIQQVAFIAGRGELEEELKRFTSMWW